MRKLLAAAAIAACFVMPAHAAGTCEPIIDIAHELVTAGVNKDDVVTTDDVGLVRAYSDALGVNVPDDADLIGAIFVRLKTGVVVGLIENKDAPCIRYKMRVSTERHKYALMTLAGV